MGAESTRNMYSNLAVKNKYDGLKLHHVGYLIKWKVFALHDVIENGAVEM
jgi:hypothetical protein